MMKVPTKEEFLAWQTHPVTQAHQQMLRNFKASIHQQWESGQFQAETIEETALANAGALGSLSVLNDLIDIDFEKLEESLNDE